MKLFDINKRVKLYKLNTKCEWIDIATGFVFAMNKPPFFLTMINEVTKGVVYQISLKSKVKFHFQKNSIITWKDPNISSDDNYALSFQNTEGLKDIWNTITMFNGNDDKEINQNEKISPEISFETLPNIIREIQLGIDSGKTKILLNELKRNDCLFIKNLGRLFEDEEKRVYEEKVSNCSKITQATSLDGIIEENKLTHFSLIFLIIKYILLISDMELLARLMCDDFYLFIFGALEYDYESPKLLKHREFLYKSSIFHNILDIKDNEIISKIQMNYRLEFLRDIAMVRSLDVNNHTIINELTQMNSIDIVQFCLCDQNSIGIMIEMLVDKDLQFQYKVLEFLIQLINCTKDLFSRLTHLEMLLYNSGILQGIKSLLLRHISKYNDQSNNTKEDIELNLSICLKAIEILRNFLRFIPHLFKDFLLNEKDNVKLIQILTTILKHEESIVIKIEISDMIKLLIDMNQDLDINFHHQMIFDNCLNDLIEYLNFDTSALVNKSKLSVCISKQIIIELLSHCLNKLKDNVQYWFIHNSIIDKVLSAINEHNKEVTLSVIKFIKNIIMTNNYNYHKSIMLSQCFEKVFMLFNKNKSKNNMVFSSIMSIFHYLIKDDHSNKLLTVIFKEYKPIIYAKENEKYFANMIKRYENGKEQFDIFHNESIGFHGLFSCNFSSYFKEEDFTDNKNNNDDDCDKKDNNTKEMISSLSFFNDNILSKLNKNSTLFFLGQKRKNENV